MAQGGVRRYNYVQHFANVATRWAREQSERARCPRSTTKNILCYSLEACLHKSGREADSEGKAVFFKKMLCLNIFVEKRIFV